MLHRYPQNQMEFDYFSSVPVYPQVSASFRKFLLGVSGWWPQKSQKRHTRAPEEWSVSEFTEDFCAKSAMGSGREL